MLQYNIVISQKEPKVTRKTYSSRLRTTDTINVRIDRKVHEAIAHFASKSRFPLEIMTDKLLRLGLALWVKQNSPSNRGD